MSRYLIPRIEESPQITLHFSTEIEPLQGETSLSSITWRENKKGAKESHDIRHVFLMTGAMPNTKWLESCLALDAKGFVKTGTTLCAHDLVDQRWSDRPSPELLETSLAVSSLLECSVWQRDARCLCGWRRLHRHLSGPQAHRRDPVNQAVTRAFLATMQVHNGFKASLQTLG